MWGHQRPLRSLVMTGLPPVIARSAEGTTKQSLFYRPYGITNGGCSKDRRLPRRFAPRNDMGVEDSLGDSFINHTPIIIKPQVVHRVIKKIVYTNEFIHKYILVQY